MHGVYDRGAGKLSLEKELRGRHLQYWCAKARASVCLLNLTGEIWRTVDCLFL
jgi:hypothetical protein